MHQRSSDTSVFMSVASLVVTLAISACNGTFSLGTAASKLPSKSGTGANGAGPGTTINGSNGQTTQQQADQVKTIGLSPMRRLTNREYTQVLRDVFGQQLDNYGYNLENNTVDGFENDVRTLAVDTTLQQQYVETADYAAAQALLSPGAPSFLSACPDQTTATEACVRASLATLVKRAFRRPPIDGEVDALYSNFYLVGAADQGDLSFETQYGKLSVATGTQRGVFFVLTRLMTSPYFLYWVELGVPGSTPDARGRVPLTASEKAARLSRLLTGSVPEADTVKAADAGQLETPAQLAAELDRLVAKYKAQRAARQPFPGQSDFGGEPNFDPLTAGLMRFTEQWLNLAEVSQLSKSDDDWAEKPAAGFDCDANRDPNFNCSEFGHTDRVKYTLRYETQRFVDDVTFNGGKLGDLFTANFTYMNALNAKFYGQNWSQPTPGGNLGPDYGMTKITNLPASQRSGILTQPAIMALTSSGSPKPMKRAVFVYTKLLCSNQAPPPPSAPTSVPNGTPGETARQQFEYLTNPAFCQGCHGRLNSLGFVFSPYTPTGRFVPDESLGQNQDGTPHTIPFDTHGALKTTDVDGTVNSVYDIGQHLAASDTARDCYVRQWFRYANGRTEVDADTPALTAIKSEFAAQGYRLDSILGAVVHSADFSTVAAPVN